MEPLNMDSLKKEHLDKQDTISTCVVYRHEVWFIAATLQE